MLATNSGFKFYSADVEEKKSSIWGGIVRAFDYGLCRMAEAGNRQANSPLLSIELAMCVAECMGKKHLEAIQTAGLV